MADFLAVNLSAIIKNQKDPGKEAPAKAVESDNDADTVDAASERDISRVTDWEKELAERVAENNKLDASKRKSDEEVEDLFFKDFFRYGHHGWDKVCAEQLFSIGNYLRKALKTLKFNPKTNPLLGFITNTYVINKLIKTGLLTADTFKAIYIALAKKLLASSELMTSNDSNIIYCQDLYNKSTSDIVKYLNIQSNILKPTASKYTAEDIEKNKKVFFFVKAIKERGELSAVPEGAKLPSAKNSSTKLNTLDFAQSLLDNWGSSVRNTNKADGQKTSATSGLARKLSKNNAQAFVAVQYLNATTNAPEANAALKHAAFKNITVEALVNVSTAVNKVMREADIQDGEVKSFIAVLLDGLESTV